MTPLSSFTAITELSDGTEARAIYFNERFSGLSQNLDELNTGSWTAPTSLSTHFVTIRNNVVNQRAFVVEVDTGDGEGYLERFSIENNPSQPNVDINFRNASIDVGTADAAVTPSNSALVFKSANTHQELIVIRQLDSNTSVAFSLSNRGQMLQNAGNLVSVPFKLSVAGDANARFQWTEFGALQWGVGGATAVDARLEREVGGVKITSGATFGIRDTFTPAAGTSSGTTGDIVWDTGFVYVCTSTDSWSRAALSTF